MRKDSHKRNSMEVANNPKIRNKMDQIKNLKFVILIIGFLIVLVIVRSLDSNVFRKDVKTAVDGTKNNSNQIFIDQFHQLNSSDLVLNLGNDDLPDSLQAEYTIRIPFENMLDKINRKKLEDVKGNLILYSADAATASKAWVILNQLGFKNVFILNTDANQDEFKYKFQPDTTVRLEQDSI